jgi:hypothetical protein
MKRSSKDGGESVFHRMQNQKVNIINLDSNENNGRGGAQVASECGLMMRLSGWAAEGQAVW